VRLATLLLWAVAIAVVGVGAFRQPSPVNLLSAVAFLLLFVVVQAQILFAHTNGSRKWRWMASRLHGSTYISDLHNLPNRNYLLAELRREMPQAREHSTPFTLIHLGMENLAEVRQRRGDDFAERSLSSLTDLLQRITRNSDFIAYLGDGRFCVLLNECTREQCWLYMKRVPGSISISDGHRMLDVPLTARVYQYDLETLYATDVLREVEEGPVLRRKEQPRQWSEAA
jgi:diguanylate cyclase (GGDEF)-like protein